MKRLLFILSVIFLSVSVFASNYPVITNITVEYNDKGAIYHFGQKLEDIGPAGDVPINKDWAIGLGHKYYVIGQGFEAILEYSGWLQQQFYGQTISELGVNAYLQRGKRYSSITHVGLNGYHECIAYFGVPDQDVHSGFPISRSIAPAGCAEVPPADDWCRITSPEIVLDHGIIRLQDAEGHQAKSSFGVKCTNAISVQFNLVSGEKYVYLDEGKSEIIVDDQPLGSKIDLPKGDSQMPIKDLLTGVTKEGFHTGSSVLVMMPY